ncbi:hypothetical protein P7C71_g5081, partial [Lecanoromycetidae sp. Uapishka_2]
MGVAAAVVLGVSNPIDAKPLGATDHGIKTIVVAGNVFLAHRQSIGALFDSIGADATKLSKMEAIASISFDDDVDKLLDHGW